MTSWLARAIVYLSAWLVPKELRARWREEWTAEIAANDSVVIRSLGAPVDAFAMRRLARSSRQQRSVHFGQWQIDLRYATRQLRRSPGHVAVVVLGLGVGLTTTIAMYSAINTGLHGELPGIVDRASVARVDLFMASSDRAATRIGFERDDWELLRRHGPLVHDVAAQSGIAVAVRFDGDVDYVTGAFASPALFSMLGTEAAAGRLLGPADDRADSTSVVIGNRLWRSRFGARPDAIGETLVAGTRTLRIVGVAPEHFAGLWTSWRAHAYPAGGVQVWLPLALARDWLGASSSVSVAARLASGVTREQARAAFDPALREFEALYPGADRRSRVRLDDLAVGMLADQPLELGGVMLASLGVPLAVLLIACANVANLRLARATARTAEWSVRTSLGATRRQLTRLLLIESALLTMFALFVSWIGVRILLVGVGQQFFASELSVDSRVAAFAILVAAAVIVLSGLAPAWLVTGRITPGLQQSAQAGGLGHGRLRNALVVTQIAISMGLTTGGSMLTRSAQIAVRERLVEFDRVLMADLSFTSQGYDTAAAAQFLRGLQARLNSDSRFAGTGLIAPLSAGMNLRRDDDPASVRRADAWHVSPDWFVAMARPALIGRTFTTADRQDIAVVNESTARSLAGSGSPVGLRVTMTDYTDRGRRTFTIVGVVGDTWRDRRDPRRPEPLVYLPMPSPIPLRVSLVARPTHDVDLAPAVRAMIVSVDGRGPFATVGPANADADEFASAQRLFAATINAIGAAALGLAMAGLFAVMAYTVSLRTREVGIRIALGARTADIRRLVFRQAIRLTAAGALAALLITLPLGYGLRFLFMGVSPSDPLVVGFVALVLVATVFVAGVVPARRAATVDPIAALRAN